MKIKNIFKKTYQSIYKKLYQYRLYKNKNIHKNFQNMNINISIVMTCFNKVEYTINGIDSVFRNTQDKNNFKYKYYLLDDCSTDSTFEKFHNRKN